MIVSLYYLKPNYEDFFRQSYDQIVDETGANPKRSYYTKVFTCKVDDKLDIDDLFSLFVNNMPADFVGHDFGVSDVIGIDKGGDHLDKGEYYFCDIIGWDKLRDWEDKTEENLEQDTVIEESADNMNTYKKIATKTVYDSDGFTTDYTLYYDVEGENYFTIFGDNELYTPDDADHDMDFEDNYDAAMEWFEDYDGFTDEPDFDVYSQYDDIVEIDDNESVDEDYQPHEMPRGVRIRFITKLVKKLMEDPYNYDHETANDIAIRRADRIDYDPRYMNTDVDAMVRSELKFTATRDEYENDIKEVCEDEVEEILDESEDAEGGESGEHQSDGYYVPKYDKEKNVFYFPKEMVDDWVYEW